MNKALILPMIFGIYFFFFIFLSTAQAYQVTYASYVSGVGSFSNNVPSLYLEDGVCTSTITVFGNFSDTTTFDTTTTIYSPAPTAIATSSLTGTTSYTYRSLGSTTTTNKGPVDYESKANITTDAASGFSKVITNYTCTTSQPVIQIITNRSNPHLDTMGSFPNAQLMENSWVWGVVPSITDTKIVYSLLNESPRFTSLTQFNHQYMHTVTTTGSSTFMYLFNSSFGGTVRIFANLSNSTFQGSGPANDFYNVDLVKLSDLSVQNLYFNYTANINLNGTSVTYSGTLSPNTEYALVFAAAIENNGGGSSAFIRPPDFVNITVSSLTPNYVCGAFTDCVDGLRQQTCVDSTGNFPEQIVFQSCLPVATASEVFGFEAYTEIGNVYECKKNPFLCTAYTTNQTIKIPSDWNVTFTNFNDSGYIAFAPKFIDMINPPADSHGIQAPESSLALLMWYAPPNLDQITQSGANVVCDNKTTGSIPSVYKNLNQSVFTDIVFPSPFMTLSLYVRKFSSPIIQYETGNPFCSPSELCYGLNCSQEPLGNYRLAILDLNQTTLIPNATLLEYYNVAGNNWSQITVDLSDLNLSTNHYYRLVISVVPPNNDVYRRDAVGVAFDGVTINNLPASLQATCESGQPICDGLNLLVPHFQNGSCIIETTINDSTCYQAQISGQIHNATVQNATVYEPIGGNTTQTWFNSAGIGFASFFISPFFLFLLIFLIIGAYADFKIKSGGLVFLSILILGIIIGTLPQVGIIPIWFTVIFTILTGGIAVYFLSNIFSRGA